MTTCTIFNIFLPKYNNCFSHHENRKTIGLVLHIECPEWSVIIDVIKSAEDFWLLTQFTWAIWIIYFEQIDEKLPPKVVPAMWRHMSQLLLTLFQQQFLWLMLWLFNQYFLKWVWNSTSSTSYICSLTPTTSRLVKVEVLWFKHLFTWRPNWF